MTGTGGRMTIYPDHCEQSLQLIGLVRRTYFYRSDGGDKQQDQDDETTGLRLPGHQILQAQNQGPARDQVRFSRMNQYSQQDICIKNKKEAIHINLNCLLVVFDVYVISIYRARRSKLPSNFLLRFAPASTRSGTYWRCA